MGLINLLCAMLLGIYLITLADPDAPDSKPNSYLHWLVPGITDLNKLPPAAIQYTGPNPPPGSGKH